MAANKHPALIDDLGGEAGIRAWVDLFYAGIAADPLLAELFPPDLTESRDKQFAFFVQYFGGPALYEQKYGKAFLRFKHRHVKIGQPERDAWMRILLDTLASCGAPESVVHAVEARVGALADDMINYHPEKKDAYYFN